MAFEQKENTGALFVNDKRETDKHPNAKGSALIDGKEYWVSAWTNAAKSGQRYQSLKFQPKDEAQDSAPPTGQAQSHGQRERDEFDDRIPF